MICVRRVDSCFVVVVCAAMSDERCDDGWFVVEPANASHAHLQRAFIYHTKVVLPPDTRVRHPMKEMENVLHM